MPPPKKKMEHHHKKMLPLVKKLILPLTIQKKTQQNRKKKRKSTVRGTKDTEMHQTAFSIQYLQVVLQHRLLDSGLLARSSTCLLHPLHERAKQLSREMGRVFKEGTNDLLCSLLFFLSFSWGTSMGFLLEIPKHIVHFPCTFGVFMLFF